MADQHHDPIAQANAAIRDLFHAAPNGRIAAEDRDTYDELLNTWLAAVKARDRGQEPPRLAA